MDKKLIKQSEVSNETGMSKSHMYALIKRGLFPKPIKLSERSSAWVESEVQDWIDAKIAARDQECLQ